MADQHKQDCIQDFVDEFLEVVQVLASSVGHCESPTMIADQQPGDDIAIGPDICRAMARA